MKCNHNNLRYSKQTEIITLIMDQLIKRKIQTFLLKHQYLQNKDFDSNVIDKIRTDKITNESIIPLDTFDELKKLFNSDKKYIFEYKYDLGNKNSDIYFVYDPKKRVNFVVKIIKIDEESYSNALESKFSVWKELYTSTMLSRLVLMSRCPSFVVNYFNFNIDKYKFINKAIFEKKKSKVLCMCFEHANMTLATFLKSDNTLKEADINRIWKTFFIQIMYSFYVIASKNIIQHNDLHLNNIFVENIKADKCLTIYRFGELNVYINNQLINFIIGDFGKVEYIFTNGRINKTKYNEHIDILDIQQLCTYINQFTSNTTFRTDYFLSISEKINSKSKLISKANYHTLIYDLFPESLNPFEDIIIEENLLRKNKSRYNFDHSNDLVLYKSRIFPQLKVVKNLFVKISNTQFITYDDCTFISLEEIKKQYPNLAFWQHNSSILFTI